MLLKPLWKVLAQLMCGYLNVLQIEIGLKVTLKIFYVTNFVNTGRNVNQNLLKAHITMYLSYPHTLKLLITLPTKCSNLPN